MNLNESLKTMQSAFPSVPAPIDLVEKEVRRSPFGEKTSGLLIARHAGDEVHRCRWSGNLGRSAALRQIESVLSDRFPAWEWFEE